MRHIFIDWRTSTANRNLGHEFSCCGQSTHSWSRRSALQNRKKTQKYPRLDSFQIRWTSALLYVPVTIHDKLWLENVQHSHNGLSFDRSNGRSEVSEYVSIQVVTSANGTKEFRLGQRIPVNSTKSTTCSWIHVFSKEVLCLVVHHLLS